MPIKPGHTEQLMDEISTLRRKVAELQGVDQRCHQAESALKAVEERNRLLGDSTPLGIFTIDSQGRITGINRKMLKMFSLTTGDDPKTINLFDYPGMAASGIVADLQHCIAQKNRSSPNIPIATPRNPASICATISVPYLEAMGPSAV
jgi:hypothetical protein